MDCAYAEEVQARIMGSEEDGEGVLKAVLAHRRTGLSKQWRQAHIVALSLLAFVFVVLEAVMACFHHAVPVSQSSQRGMPISTSWSITAEGSSFLDVAVVT